MKTRVVGPVSVWESLSDTWSYRHFAFYLARSDIESRFRRSALGVVWAMVHPFVFTVLYSLVLSTLFKQPFADYSVYVFTGFVLWNAVSAFANLGAHCFVNASGYLRQSSIPLVVFPIRTSLSIGLIYLIECCSLMLFTAIMVFFFGSTVQISMAWFWIFPIGAALSLFGVAIVTLAGFLNVQFRDTQQFISVGTQALWFASPVFFSRELFDAPLMKFWTSINPIAAFCDVFRGPFLNGELPKTEAWMTIGVWVGVLWVLALVTLRLNSRRIVMYL